MKRALPILSFLIALVLGWVFTPATIAKLKVETELSTRILRIGKARAESGERERVREIDRQMTREEKVRQVIALASSIPVDEIAKWHRSDLIDVLDDDLETLFFRITSERWLEANPKEFMEWAMMMNYRQADLHLAQWAIKDPEAANDFIKGLPRSDRSEKISEVALEMVKSDPGLALEFLSRNLSVFSGQNDYYFRKSLNSLAKENPEALLAAGKTWPKAARDQASSAIAGVYLHEDFAKGLSFLQSEGLNWQAMSQSADRKIAAILIENRNQLPDGWLSQMLRRSPWAFTSAANGLELLESDPASLELDSRSFARLVESAGNIPITEKNRGRLMAVINGETVPLENRETILRDKIRKWNKSDSDGLRDWLGTLDDPALHAAADEGLAQFDNQSDFKPTVEGDIAKFMGPERLDYNATKRIAKWTPAETEKALGAFRGLSPEEKQVSFESVRDGLQSNGTNFSFYKEVLTEASKFPPSEGENTRNEQERIAAFQTFSRNYASMEPAKAAAWAAQLAPGDARLNAISGVANAWNQYSPSETEAWIRTLPAADQEAAKKVLE